MGGGGPTRASLELGSRTDLIWSSFSEGFVYFDVDAPPYPAGYALHVGEDSYVETSVPFS